MTSGIALHGEITTFDTLAINHIACPTSAPCFHIGHRRSTLHGDAPLSPSSQDCQDLKPYRSDFGTHPATATLRETDFRIYTKYSVRVLLLGAVREINQYFVYHRYIVMLRLSLESGRTALLEPKANL